MRLLRSWPLLFGTLVGLLTGCSIAQRLGIPSSSMGDCDDVASSGNTSAAGCYQILGREPLTVLALFDGEGTSKAFPMAASPLLQPSWSVMDWRPLANDRALLSFGNGFTGLTMCLRHSPDALAGEAVVWSDLGDERDAGRWVLQRIECPRGD